MANLIQALLLDNNFNLLGLLLSDGNTVDVNKFRCSHPELRPDAFYRLLKTAPVMFNDRQPQPNQLRIVQRVGKNADELIGCEVMLGHRSQMMSLAELRKKLNYLSSNYTIRQRSDNKLVLCGKRGYSVNTIPLQLPTAQKKPTQKLNSVVKSAPLSFISLLATLRSLNGYVIIDEGTQYKASTPAMPTVGSQPEFIPGGIGQISAPEVSYSNKINCNLPFRQPGTVALDLTVNSSEPTPVPVYRMRNKTVFKNSTQPNISKLGIVVPRGNAHVIQSKFSSYITEPIDAQAVKQLVSLYISGHPFIGWWLKLDAVEVMPKNIAPTYMRTAAQVNALVLKKAAYDKAISETRKLIKEINAALGATLSTVCPPSAVAQSLKFYASNPTDIQTLTASGIDVKTGLYSPKYAYAPKSDTQTDTATGPVAAEFKFKIPAKVDVTVAEEYRKYSDKLAQYSASLQQLKSNVVTNADKLIELKTKIQNLSRDIKWDLAPIDRELWLFRVASYVQGNYTHFAIDDFDNYSEKRLTNTYKYTNKGYDIGYEANLQAVKYK